MTNKMINILLMTYNGSQFIKEAIQSFRDIGPIHVFIDSKTTDSTELMVRSLGIVPQFLDFTDFATSRNQILEKFPTGYRFFIDDSYIFRGHAGKFKKEVLASGCDVIGIPIMIRNEWTVYSKITRGPVYYVDKVHEYINKPRQYLVQNGYIEELDSKEHLIRRLNRFPRDLEILYSQWYKDPSNDRAVYYICRTYLVCYKYKIVPKRLVLYFLTLLSTMNSKYSTFAKRTKVLVDS